ncbi:MAG: tripartite tricarboxylate transporter substrate-binding protein [Hyphomicrobium sp.]
MRYASTPAVFAGIVTAILALSAAGGAADAQTSGRTVRIIYAFAAGGSGDGLARLVAERLGSRLGVPAIVENRSGASGRIGTRAVIAAEPDGNTLLLSAMGPIALHPVVYTNLDFEPFNDLAPLAQLATFDIGLAVSAGTPAATLGQLVGWIKANPDKATYGTSGLGGLPHFFAVMFSASAGVALRSVPYRGAAAVTADLVAGQLPIAFVPAAENVELHKGGRTRILATSGAVRSPFLPDVPTFKQAGFDLLGEGWFGMYAPQRTPADALARLRAAHLEIMRDSTMRERIAGLGLVATGRSWEELDRQQRADRAAWTPAIKASGFKPTD